MTGLVAVKLVTVMIAVLPAAKATLQPDHEFVTENNWTSFSLLSSPPALTLITFSRDANTSDTQVCFSVRGLFNRPASENFTLGHSDMNNTIAVLYTSNFFLEEYRDVVNMLTGKAVNFRHRLQMVSVWTDQTVRWQVFNNVPGLLNSLTAASSASALPSSSLSCYLSPGFFTVASLCILLALSTLVLSVHQCLRCASARNGHRQTASSSDSMTFKSTENLVSQHAYSPYNYNGRGSLHISENSLYGVI